MIATALLAIGLVLIVEGLAYVLAPSLVERLLEAMRAIPEDARRMIGMTALVIGLLLAWLGKWFGA